MAVPDAIQLVKDRREELYEHNNPKVGNELAQMIESIDENQLIAYVKEELERRDLIWKQKNTLGMYFHK